MTQIKKGKSNIDILGTETELVVGILQGTEGKYGIIKKFFRPIF